MSRGFHFFTVTFLKAIGRQVASVRARDKRQAKLTAKRRFGTGIRILKVIRTAKAA